MSPFEREYRRAFPDDAKMAEVVARFNVPEPDGRCIHRSNIGRRCKRPAGKPPDQWWCSIHCPVCG